MATGELKMTPLSTKRLNHWQVVKWFLTLLVLMLPSMKGSVAAGASSLTRLPHLPSLTIGGADKYDVVLVPVTRGVGSSKLPSYTPRGRNLYIQFACRGSGSFAVSGYFKLSSCNYGAALVAVEKYPIQAGRLVAPKVVAPRSVQWELLITSGP